MASTSSSSIQKSFKYDVFLSFRGKDTRNSFVGHLYQALKQKGIETYKDDKKIEQGKPITEQLIKSIEASRFYIIVFSKTYASSSWCLDELVQIMKCKKTTEKNVYPVFFDVEPTEVRKQSGAVKEAFAEHEKNEAAGKWREAMKEASNLAGWELKATANGDESELILIIVHVIFKKKCSTLSNAEENLVGMETRISDVLSLLEIGAEDVRMIGIRGMGGGGKTTLAGAVCDHISLSFEGISFVENVRRVVSKESPSGLKMLQKQILADVLNKQDIIVSSFREGKMMMRNMIRGTKVLIVLDDVDDKCQLEALAGDLNWFKSGSRIIITTRDEHVLLSHGVSLICNVNLLTDDEAVRLFSRHAFRKDIPTLYNEMSGQVVRYAAGLPLTVKVLGSFLCDKTDLEWKEALERLEKVPEHKTQEILKISYDALEDDHKEIFLDVACILKGEQKDKAIRVLESCGVKALIGLKVLEQKSLLSVSKHGSLAMHDRIEEMGKYLDCHLHPDEHNRHSRLWIDEEIEDILANTLINEETRCIKLLPKRLDLRAFMTGLRNMKKVRVLYMCSGSDWDDSNVSQLFPNSLKYLCWRAYPFSSLHETFQADNLVGLDMSFSSILEVWKVKEGKALTKLRFLDLSHTSLRMLDLRLTPNLERLDLTDCWNLVEINAPVGCLKNLLYLDLSGSGWFKSFLFDKQSKSLKVGSLSELHIIVESKDKCALHPYDNMPKYNFTCLYKEDQAASSFGNLEKLISIRGCACTNLESFLKSICSLNCLRKLTLEGTIPEVPKDLHHLLYLEELILSSTMIKHLPDSVCLLKQLKSLKLQGCGHLEKLPEGFGQLECLKELNITGTAISHLPECIFGLKGVHIIRSEALKEAADLAGIEPKNTFDGHEARFIKKSFKYDVFLSFKGEDTRKNFVDHLYHALENKGIETYQYDEKIKQGKMISDELIKAIEDSKFYIIVFSKNYASSSWCLEELVKIMECRKGFGHTAYPLFYDVEPTEVRKQCGSVGDAFAKHKDEEAARKWREALKEASYLAGWELKSIANWHEANFIQKIIQDISLELCFIDSSVVGNLVGMETRVDEVISYLETGVDDIRMIGIKGMGGAGKTTLARAVFDKISFQFEGRSFVGNVKEKSKPSLSGLNSLQKQVLSDVLNDQGITVSGVHEGKKIIQKKMRIRKVLIVLDDVDKIEQLEALVGDRDWFKPGSRIIITTRDEQVLVAHKVNLIHDVHLLDDKEAICLFSRHALRREIPIKGYKELSEQVVRYAAGLPLTIKVLGSFLCGKNDLDWKDALERLETIPLNETMKVLELSYSDLEEDYKEIFLDVACIFKGWLKDDAVIALESCGLRAQIGLRVLELKSLITISEYGVLDMHDHIEEMGKNIVCCVNPNKPEMHSRLWIKEEIVDILANDSGTQATKCISWTSLDEDAEEFNFEILMNGLANMKELRFLHVCTRQVSEEEVSNWNFDEDSLHLPNALWFLRWDYYPFSSLPKTFHAKNLVGLEMKYDNIVQLWKDGEEKPFLKLRFLKLSSPKLRTLDLSVAPNLETLILERCFNLVEVHFQVTPNLKELRIRNCRRLEKLHMPVESPKLRSLDLNNSNLRTLHLGITPNLETLSLLDCPNMVELRMPAECPKLVNLNFSHLQLKTLHLGITPNLETLILEYFHDLVEVHFQVTPNLKELRIGNCYRLEKLHMPAESLKLLRSLDLSHLHKLRTFHLEIAPNLETLRLKDCTDMVELHMPAQCPKLVDLDLSNLKLTTLHLGITPNLKTVSLKGCRDLVELQIPAECPKLANLDLKNCIQVAELPEEIGRLEYLKKLDITGTRISHLPESIFRVKGLRVVGSRRFLESCGFTSEIKTDYFETFCYI